MTYKYWKFWYNYVCQKWPLARVRYIRLPGTVKSLLSVLYRRVKSDFLVSVRMISDFGVLEWTLAQDGHSRFVVLRCMTWYSYTKVLSLVAQSTSQRSL